MYLSKSKYTKGIRCPKMLWMDEYMPSEAPENPALEAIFETGNMVGDLARQYFGNCVLVDFDKGLQSMLKETQEYIATGETHIAEASFSAERLFCSVDILRKTESGWDIIEVKSSNDIHDIYYDDMAFQYYVLKKSGMNITGVYLMHLNRDYTRYGALDLKQLFLIENCTQTVLEMQNDLPANIERIRKYMADAGDKEPKQALSMSCYEPYGCAYFGYCTKCAPKDSVLNINRLAKRKKVDLFNEGIISFEDIAREKPHLSANQWLQVDTALNHYPPHIDKLGIKSCIEQYTYPIYYLDFETYQPAIPEFDGEHPYMQVPFQYSLHIQQEKGGELEHREFLGISGTDVKRAIAEQLCKDIPKDVCVLAYNMTFEKQRISELAGLYPDLAEHLTSIHDNIQDLMLPFQYKYYYSEALEGSYSIKKVLPTLCPNDPELDYHALDGIHNGGEAMAAFPDLPNHTPEEQETIRKNLLAYCGLDTLAMVKVLEKLCELCE